MKTGYQDFFKKAQRVADKGRGPAREPSRGSSEYHPSKDVFRGASAEQLRTLLRAKQGKPKLKRNLALKPIFGLAFLSGVLGFGYANFEQVEKFVENVEISFMGVARANEPAPAAASTAAAGKPAEGEKAADAHAPAAEKAISSAPATPEEYNHLVRLRERKAELDVREEELARTEAELAAQKKELEERLKQLEATRNDISTVLKDRAEADDKKVDDLVAVYSTMKPQQAAKIFESMDESLAVEILGRMKKKPAAEILNLIKAEKAQMISEKYAGYKRKNQP